MRQISVTLPPLHATQQLVFDSPARYRVLACGRRWGKSRLAATISAHEIFQGHNIWWVAPTYDIAKRVGWRMVERLLRPLIEREGWERNKADLTIQAPNGGRFAVKSADRPETLVGEGLDCVVIDEAGIVREQAWVESLRPALGDRQGRAVLIGTPKGRNWFWGAYQRGLDPVRPEWEAWRLPTDNNPHFPRDEMENARRESPDHVFRQEWLAEFLENEGTVFRNVAACVDTSPLPLREEMDIVFGVDWGRLNDYTAIVAFDRNSNRVVAVDRFTDISFPIQQARLKAFAAQWAPYMIVAEDNSFGLPIIEALQRDGLPVRPFTTTYKSKRNIIEALMLAFEQQAISIPDYAPLIHELEAFEQTATATGYRFSHPEGGHDDTVIALALALYAGTQHKTGVRFFD